MAKRGIQQSEARKTRASRSYENAKSRAGEYLASPEKLDKLVNDATEKAKRRNGPLREVWSSLMACIRLIRAYANGSYRRVPWQSILMIVASVVYFVMPVDLIPDFLAGFGLLDDAALLGWTIRTFGADIDAFVQWEEKQN
ncbi:MAG: YkvA family protein [Nitrospirota bacterium]